MKKPNDKTPANADPNTVPGPSLIPFSDPMPCTASQPGAVASLEQSCIKLCPPISPEYWREALSLSPEEAESIVGLPAFSVAEMAIDHPQKFAIIAREHPVEASALLGVYASEVAYLLLPPDVCIRFFATLYGVDPEPYLLGDLETGSTMLRERISQFDDASNAAARIDVDGYHAAIVECGTIPAAIEKIIGEQSRLN